MNRFHALGVCEASKRRFQDDAPFFLDGTAGREVPSGARDASWPDSWRSGDPEIICSFCKAEFWSLRTHESHVESAHAHLCATCGAGFALERWLTQHIQEAHDSYFAALVRRGTPMFACIVDGCASPRFLRCAERDKHLVAAHGFPTGGLRRLRRRKFSTARDGSRLQSLGSGALAPTQAMPRAEQSPSFATLTASATAPMAEASANAAVTPGALPSAALRSRLCKHFASPKGCRLGAECRFRHAVVQPAGMTDDEDGLGTLTAALGKLSTRAPTAVYFGRRGRGGARMPGSGR